MSFSVHILYVEVIITELLTLAHYRNALWRDLISPGDPDRPAKTTVEVFETGLQRSTNKNCLGYRPLISKSPIKYADKYVWQTYAEVSERRYNLGSAIEGLFRSGAAGGGEYPTVGIWSINRPGIVLLHVTSMTLIGIW